MNIAQYNIGESILNIMTASIYTREIIISFITSSLKRALFTMQLRARLAPITILYAIAIITADTIASGIVDTSMHITPFTQPPIMTATIVTPNLYPKSNNAMNPTI